MSKSVRRRTYTAEEKARGVALVREKGLMAACAELGVASSTVWGWIVRYRPRLPFDLSPVPA